ncbi:hypothetical protein [Bradyrhizobium oropedii]|uniref:hypothetical protein n=1 Tax=Bradyrhizobium oropedii TaxID=1571201 RepID=UPI001E649B34|nr:hypothetical protein [Bradyrhizobium oropedii]
MARFPVHTLDSAPEASKSTLREVEARFGMIPNLAAAMATSPVLVQSFLGIFDKVHGGSFSEPQIQTVLLTDAVTNAAPGRLRFIPRSACRPASIRLMSTRCAPVARLPTSSSARSRHWRGR